MAVTIKGSGQVPVQVATVNKTDTFSLSSLTWTDITGFTLNITPTSSSNRVLVIASVAIGIASGGDFAYIRLLRNGTVIDVGDTASNRPLVTGVFSNPTGGNPLYGITQVPIVFLDSPSSTSAVTYKVQLRGGSSGANAVYINRTGSDRDNADYEPRTASSMTLMELAYV
jgi:hypothetical protein